MLQCNQLADFTNRAWQEQESGGTWDSQNLPGPFGTLGDGCTSLGTALPRQQHPKLWQKINPHPQTGNVSELCSPETPNGSTRRWKFPRLECIHSPLKGEFPPLFSQISAAVLKAQAGFGRGCCPVPGQNSQWSLRLPSAFSSRFSGTALDNGLPWQHSCLLPNSGAQV